MEEESESTPEAHSSVKLTITAKGIIQPTIKVFTNDADPEILDAAFDEATRLFALSLQWAEEHERKL